MWTMSNILWTPVCSYFKLSYLTTFTFLPRDNNYHPESWFFQETSQEISAHNYTEQLEKDLSPTGQVRPCSVIRTSTGMQLLFRFKHLLSILAAFPPFQVKKWKTFRWCVAVLDGVVTKFRGCIMKLKHMNGQNTNMLENSLGKLLHTRWGGNGLLVTMATTETASAGCESLCNVS